VSRKGDVAVSIAARSTTYCVFLRQTILSPSFHVAQWHSHPRGSVYVFSWRLINDSTNEKPFRKMDGLSCIIGYLLLQHVVCSWLLWTIVGGIRGVGSVITLCEAEIVNRVSALSGIGRSVLEAASFASARLIATFIIMTLPHMITCRCRISGWSWLEKQRTSNDDDKEFVFVFQRFRRLKDTRECLKGGTFVLIGSFKATRLMSFLHDSLHKRR